MLKKAGQAADETAPGGRWVYDTSFEPVPKLHFVDSAGDLVPSLLVPTMVEQYFKDTLPRWAISGPFLTNQPGDASLMVNRCRLY